MLKIMEMQTELNNEVFNVPFFMVETRTEDVIKASKKASKKGIKNYELDCELKCVLTEAEWEWTELRMERLCNLAKELGLDIEDYNFKELEEIEQYYIDTTSKLSRESNKDNFMRLQQEFLNKYPLATTFKNWRSVEDLFFVPRGY
jgi:hypothetical protein